MTWAVSTICNDRSKTARVASFLLVHAVDELTHAAIADRPETLEDGSLARELTALVLGYLQARR